MGQARGEAHVQGEQIRYGRRRQRSRQESVLGRAEESAVREEVDVGRNTGHRVNMGICDTGHTT